MLEDAPAFEEWLELKRTTLSRLYRSALNKFALQSRGGGRFARRVKNPFGIAG